MSDVMHSLCPIHIKGLSILGGEPLDAINLETVLTIVHVFRSKFNNTKDLWIYTGWTYEELLSRNCELTNEILSLTNVLVDGKFEQDLYSPKLRFRGSSNQRVLDLKESLKQNKPILYME